jgi:tetratricopeptide (TPR) repeat protein
MPLRRFIFLLLTFCVTAVSAQVLPDSSSFEFKTDSLKKCLTTFTQNDTLRVKTLLDLAYWYNTFDIDQSLNYIGEAEKIVQQINAPFYTGRVHFTYGNSYLKNAHYQQALFHFLQALHIYEQLKKMDNVARSLYNIGVIYVNLNKLDKAEKYFTQALEIKLKNNLLDEIGIAYTGVGYIAEVKKDYPKALYYYNKTLTNGIENKNNLIIQLAYTDIGNTHLHLNNLELAKKNLSIGLKMSLASKNLEQICINCLALGELYDKENNPGQAEYYYGQALFYAKKAGLRSKEKDAYKGLSELYFKLGQNDKAYLNRLQYEALNDSALNQETYKQVNDLQESYEIEKRNAQINLLNKEKELADANASKDELFRNILITVCVLVLIIAIILLRNVRLKQHLNKTLKSENKQLEEENIQAKYEVLKSRVNPHFLFNSLATLTSIIDSDKQKAIEFIEHFSELYRQVLESGEANVVPLTQEIKISLNYIYLQQVRFGDKLNITFAITDEKNYAIPSFVIQMMIENAIKHNIISSAKNLRVTITQYDNMLVIENNLQTKIKNVPSTKIGQQNIIGRYKRYTDVIPVFEQTATHYRVTLPLLLNQTIKA